MNEREVTKDELKKLQKQEKALIKIRGEIINGIVAIEATLDEVICGHFMRGKHFSQCMKILSWKDFPFVLKIKLFNEIDFGEKFNRKKKEIVENLKDLNSIRNKMAHRLGIWGLEDKYIGDIKIDKKFIDETITKIKNTHSSLQAILYYWAGLKPEDIKRSKIKWIQINKIKGHFLEKES